MNYCVLRVNKIGQKSILLHSKPLSDCKHYVNIMLQENERMIQQNVTPEYKYGVFYQHDLEDFNKKLDLIGR